MIATYPARGWWGLSYGGRWLAVDFGLVLTERPEHARKFATYSAAAAWRTRNALDERSWTIQRIEREAA